MGWTYTYELKPATVKEQAELVLRKFNEAGWEKPTQVLKHKIVRNVWYALVKTTIDPETDKHTYWFAVYLLDWRRDTGELGIKEMTSECGPAYYDCPVTWFKDIPVLNKYDEEWREACRYHQGETKKQKGVIKNLKAGDIVRFKCQYDGSDTWIYAGDGTFRKTNSSPCVRLVGWKKRMIID